jgi:hypothetical protein
MLERNRFDTAFPPTILHLHLDLLWTEHLGARANPLCNLDRIKRAFTLQENIIDLFEMHACRVWK